MKSLIREATGNVVLRNGKTALRFFREFGGTPLEFWHEPFPLLTNSFPGSGASWTCEVGQDPTQASANGITPNPICCYNIPETAKYNYYIREQTFNQTTCEYSVQGFYPDFWLSAESIDDYVLGNWLLGISPVFNGSSSNKFGIFCPGNEMEPGKIRKYPNGRIAFKTVIQIAASDGLAGAIFRKDCKSDAPTLLELEQGNGYRIVVSRATGQWSLIRTKDLQEKVIAWGRLSRAHRKLLASSGLLLEVRTNNVVRGAIDVYFNDDYYISVNDPNPILGDCFGLYAQASKGAIAFSGRQVFDLGLIFTTRYIPKGASGYQVDLDIQAFEPRTFYRAVYGVFLNPVTFPIAARQTCNVATSEDVNNRLMPLIGKAYFAGHVDGSHGVKLSNAYVAIDGARQDIGPHVLLSKQAINNEFVIMANALPVNAKLQAQSIHMSLVLEFSR